MKQLKERDIPKGFKNWIRTNFIDIDKIDVLHEYDRTLTIQENQTLFLEKFNSLLTDRYKEKEMINKIKEEQEKQKEFEIEGTKTGFKAEWLNNNRAVAIIGNTGEGKTNLAFYFAERCNHKNKYLLGYPKRMKGFISLNSTEDLGKIKEGLLIIDEFSRYFPLWEKRSNESLLNLLQFAEHNKIKLILTTTLSQFITKQCEALIPCWAMKQINIRRLKNGSTPSYALKYVIKHPNISSDFMKVSTDEFVWFNENGEIGENGIYTFPDMQIEKDWGNCDKNAE